MDRYFTSVDIGTTKVCAVIARADQNNVLRIEGEGISPVGDIKHGVVTDVEKTALAVEKALQEAGRKAGIVPLSVYVGIPGYLARYYTNSESIYTGRDNDNKGITTDDINELLEKTGDINIDVQYNRIDVVPVVFRLDDFDEIYDPVGMVGEELSVEADITALDKEYTETLNDCLGMAGMSLDGIITDAYSNGYVLLTQEEKSLGTVLIDVGGTITTVNIYKEGRLCFSGLVPAGGEHITGDISISLEINRQEADNMKRQYIPQLVSLSKKDSDMKTSYESINGKIRISEFAEVVDARVNDIFMLAARMIREAGFEGLLEKGAVLTGAGIIYIENIGEITSEILGIPVRLIDAEAVGATCPEAVSSVCIARFVHAGFSFGRRSCSIAQIQKKQTDNSGKAFNNFPKRMADREYTQKTFVGKIKNLLGRKF